MMLSMVRLNSKIFLKLMITDVSERSGSPSCSHSISQYLSNVTLTYLSLSKKKLCESEHLESS